MKKELIKYINEIKFILLFYIFGDFITTVWAIENGLAYEGNKYVANAISIAGYSGILYYKSLFLIFITIVYLYTTMSHSQIIWKGWKITTTIVSLMGLFLIMNNILVILGHQSPIFVLMNM